MVTSSEIEWCKTRTDQLQKTENLNSGLDGSASTKKGSSFSSSPDKDVSKLSQSPNANFKQSSKLSIIPFESDDSHQDPSPEITMQESAGQMLNKLPPRRNPEVVGHVSKSNQEPNLPVGHVLNSNPVSKPSVDHVLKSHQEPKQSTVIPDRPSEDGYNWRKYGQKFVRGNEFIRSYYKCTSPNCPSKKQVERKHDGHITDTKYLRKHEHPKPKRPPPITANFVLPIQARKLDSTSLAISEGESVKSPRPSITVARDDDEETDVPVSNRTRDDVDDDDDPELKRQKRDGSIANDSTPVNKISGDPRIVVQTTSEVDIVNDGYRWRKYGQKLVKGNPNPRSYYRCSSVGCPVKKHVERASSNPKVVLTTYEGQHDHEMPGGRTVTFNSTTEPTSRSPP
jgi:WRKY transcription factor 1